MNREQFSPNAIWYRSGYFAVIVYLLAILNFVIASISLKNHVHIPILFNDVFILPILFAVSGEYFAEDFSLKKFGLNFEMAWWKNLFFGFLAAFSLLLIGYGYAHLAGEIKINWSIDNLSSFWSEGWGVLINLFVVQTLIAFTREVMFRGFYFPLWASKFGPLLGMIFAALAFGVLQLLGSISKISIEAVEIFGNMNDVPFTSFSYIEHFVYYSSLGLLLGVLAFKTGTLWLSLGFLYGILTTQMFLNAVGVGMTNGNTTYITYLFAIIFLFISMIILNRTPRHHFSTN